MPTPKVRADYGALKKVAQSFTQQAEATRQSLQAIQHAKGILEGGDWVGRGANAFYQEMDATVLPAIIRLVAALECANQVSGQISHGMQQAEEEAARVFRIGASGGTLADAAEASFGTSVDGLTASAKTAEAAPGSPVGPAGSATAASTTAQVGTKPVSHSTPKVHYSLKSPDVLLSADARMKLTQIADRYYERTKKSITVTSGTRSTTKQAVAMYDMLKNKPTDYSNYINKKAAGEIRQAYDDGITAGKAKDQIIADMSQVIERQMAAGTYVSRHLRAGAFDIRTSDMSTEDRQEFMAAVKDVLGKDPLQEQDHFHVQF